MTDLTCKKYFEHLAARICGLWSGEKLDESAFSEVAYRVLTDDPPSAHVSFIDAVNHGFFTYPMPVQEDIEAKFGHPPLTVYWQPDFRIEVLFWLQGVTGIHQHAFSGAFHVMEGSSLHISWDFQCEEKVNTQLLFGHLKVKKAELLRAGNTRPIIAGNSFIHATYHLDRPTVSVVIRTNGEKYHLPQYTYLPPSIAYEARDISPRIKRHIQLLRLLSSTGRYDELIDILFNLFDHSDHHSVFHYLLIANTLFKDETILELILSWADKKHSRLVEACRPALIEVARRARITSGLDKLTKSDLQYFIALLLNIPEREDIFNLIRERYPDGDPITMIVGWMNELSSMGLYDLSFSEPWMEAFRKLLAAASAAQSVQTVSASGEQVTTAVKMDEVAEFSKAVSNHWLIQPLFL